MLAASAAINDCIVGSQPQNRPKGMDPVFRQLLILMIVVWTVAVALRRIGLPTVMGELAMGVILGPAVLG